MANEIRLTDELLKELRSQPQDPGFSADEMILCSSCERPNPPTRLNCFYCSAALALHPDSLILGALKLRKLETWELGFNVACPAADQPGDADSQAAGQLLSVDPETIASLMGSGCSFPLSRVEDESSAATVADRLSRCGFSCSVVPDRTLVSGRPHRRLRSLEFDTHSLTAVDFNTGERFRIGYPELALVVTGSLETATAAAIEKRKRGKSKLLDLTETSSDERIIDLYDSSSSIGYRVLMSGFDFSCLGSQKSLLASENMYALTDTLLASIPGLNVVTGYDSIKTALSIIWEVEKRKDFQGLKRSGFGKSDFGNVTTVSNLQQFNKFSRLQRELL